jgi:glycosyltransferase involved in cell wall biosynthesis
VYGIPKIETKGYWQVPNLTIYEGHAISQEFLRRWIEKNELDMVVFNEEYDWDLVRSCKRTGVKVITYLDYYEKSWDAFMGLYDAVLCSTKRTFDLVKKHGNAHYIGWSIDTDLFKPHGNGQSKYTFFHNAGWLGTNYRKMTPAVIVAFEAISRHMPGVSLLVHAQCGVEKLPTEVVQIVETNSRITYIQDTVPAPGLYHLGKILVFPSKLEGLGLPLLEGIACGLAVVATDAPPMNEFVRDGFNGLLVPVSETVTRADHIAFPENLVKIGDLAVRMARLAQDMEEVTRMGQVGRQFMVEEMSEAIFYEKLQQVFAHVTS